LKTWTSGPEFFTPQQFENPDNPRIHYEETARELWDQITRAIACFVAGIGSCGTLQGGRQVFEKCKRGVWIAAFEPKNASALLGHELGLRQMQGIGDGFVTDVLDRSLLDEVIEVTDEDAIETTSQLGRDFGMLVGLSSGANVWADRQLAARIKGNIINFLPDRAERYFSTALM
jgi:cysteine synthase A